MDNEVGFVMLEVEADPVQALFTWLLLWMEEFEANHETAFTIVVMAERLQDQSEWARREAEQRGREEAKMRVEMVRSLWKALNIRMADVGVLTQEADGPALLPGAVWPEGIVHMLTSLVKTARHFDFIVHTPPR